MLVAEKVEEWRHSQWNKRNMENYRHDRKQKENPDWYVKRLFTDWNNQENGEWKKEKRYKDIYDIWHMTDRINKKWKVCRHKQIGWRRGEVENRYDKISALGQNTSDWLKHMAEHKNQINVTILNIYSMIEVIRMVSCCTQWSENSIHVTSKRLSICTDVLLLFGSIKQHRHYLSGVGSIWHKGECKHSMYITLTDSW